MTNKAFSNWKAVRKAIKRAARSLVPPPNIKPSEWAERNVRIPIGNAIPGPINFRNAPYQRGMIDAIKEPGVFRIDFMTGAQLGKTTVQQCITGYFIDHEPRSQIIANPTQGDIQTFLETKLKPMLSANPKIANKLAKARSREGVNNSRMISYIGGWLMMAWFGSPRTLRGRSAPVTHADEIDGVLAAPEGCPIELLAQRSASFGDLILSTRSSTPTIKGESRIEAGFLAGDQRRYFVPCPHCGHCQPLRWEQVRWDGRESADVKQWELDVGREHKPETAMYLCEHPECGTMWDDGERIAAIRGAEENGGGWRAAKPYTGHISFHAPELLSTFRKIRDIVRSYLDKIAVADVQSFINVSMGETFEEDGEKADPDSLMKRREEYRAQVPEGALVLTAGVDMQIDRLEVEVVGWGVGEQSWNIEYRTIWGDPMTPDPWDELEEMLGETYLHESGSHMPISSTCVDTGGTSGYTQAAYDWLKGKTGRRIFGIKGGGTWGSPVVAAPSRRQSGKNKRKVDIFIVGVDEAKQVIMRRLGQKVPGPGYCHFPVERDAEYFKQLTAEKLTLRYVKGQAVREWKKHDKARNEAFDCRVYAYAALKILQPSFKRLSERAGKDRPPAANDNAFKRHEPRLEHPKKQPENPPEEQKPATVDTAKVKRPSKPVKPAGRRKSFATSW